MVQGDEKGHGGMLKWFPNKADVPISPLTVSVWHLFQAKASSKDKTDI